MQRISVWMYVGFSDCTTSKFCNENWMSLIFRTKDLYFTCFICRAAELLEHSTNEGSDPENCVMLEWDGGWSW